MKNSIVVILAAGESTRFKSAIPKVAHNLLDKPIILRLVKKLQSAFVKIIIIVGHKKDVIINTLSKHAAKSGKSGLVFVEQTKRLGSGDAVKQAKKAIGNFKGNVVILCGDIPLIEKDSLKNLIQFHTKKKAACTVLTFEPENPFGYGRIVRDESGIKAIVEERDADEATKEIKESNSGIYVFSAGALFDSINLIKPNNAKNEYYLTDIVEILKKKNKIVAAYKISDSSEVMGINTRNDLSNAENILRARILKKLMIDGVTITDPATTYIGEDVKIENDTVILPCTIIKGNTSIKTKSVIGPFSHIDNCKIGVGSKVKASFLYGTDIPAGREIGPFADIRNGKEFFAGKQNKLL